MCCGAKSTPRLNLARTSIARPVGMRAQSGSPSPFPSVPASVVFEYTGATGLTVVSPVTGKRYRFDAPGAQLTVDARDHNMLLYVPNLRPTRFSR
jgi:hypothetical protein